MKSIKQTDLLLNPDGSVYHLQLRPEELANTIFLVGDPQRVEKVSKYFDSIEIKKRHREFVSHTGYLNGQEVSVISTGIGTGNIDIVLNELDALVNIDLKNRTIKQKITSLNIIRLGTSGALNAETAPDTLLLSSFAFSMDGLLNYYDFKYNSQEENLYQQLQAHFASFPMRHNLYVAQASQTLLQRFKQMPCAITFTCIGFYGPQYRQVRSPLIDFDLIKHVQGFQNQHGISNLEMETAAIYGLGRLLNHHCLSVNAIIVNRATNQVSKNPELLVEKMIASVLDGYF